MDDALPTFKILTLWQPWATAVALSLKAHETRIWSTAYRGPLLIHAAGRDTREIREFVAWMVRLLCERRPDVAVPDPFPFGAVLAVADVAGCGPTDGLFPVTPADDLDRELGNWAPGRFAWRLANVRPLATPIPHHGQQGLQDAPPSLVRKVLEQIAEQQASRGTRP